MSLIPVSCLCADMTHAILPVMLPARDLPKQLTGSVMLPSQVLLRMCIMGSLVRWDCGSGTPCRATLVSTAARGESAACGGALLALLRLSIGTVRVSVACSTGSHSSRRGASTHWSAVSLFPWESWLGAQAVLLLLFENMLGVYMYGLVGEVLVADNLNWLIQKTYEAGTDPICVWDGAFCRRSPALSFAIRGFVPWRHERARPIGDCAGSLYMQHMAW